MNTIVRGRKSSKSASSSGDEAPDTLRSSVKVNLIEALGEGPIVGLVNGGNSIYFDDTPLLNVDGTKNFVGVEFDDRKGLPDQEPLPGPAQTSTPFTVETQVKQSTPVIRTIEDTTVTAVQVIIRIPSLVLADQVTGEVKGTTVQYLIERRAAGADWEVIQNVVISNQKVTSAYKKQHFVNAPDASGNPWDIRVRRLTDDPDPVESQFLQNQTFWESYSTIVTGKFTYDDTALIALYIDAFLFGANVGTRSYHVRGLIIDVPSNYDTITKTYSGIWDGTFKAAWTSNPAWVFYDLITNNRYGLGEFVNAALIDKWSLYQIGQYCDALVPSGFKRTDGTDILEPRFAFNGVINNREEAYNVLQSITSAFRGMAYWSLGQVFCAADMPSDPVVALSPANVLGGHFQYSGTSMKSRHSVAVVTWQDPNNLFRDAPEVVQDDDMIQRFGWRQVDISLKGCTSRGQAHRYGKWVLDTEKNQTETIQFSMSWDGYVLHDNQALKPGDIMLVTDPRKNGNYRAGGRLAAVNSANSMVLDFPFEFENGVPYTLTCLLPDGSLETKNIGLWAGDNKTLTLSSSFSAAPINGADFIIQSTNLVARQYRVLAVQEDGENKFKVTGLIHDPNKFARVEQNLALDPIPYVRPRNVISKVTDISAVEARYFQNGVTHSRVTLSWTGPNDFQVQDYIVTANSPHGYVNFNSVQAPTIDIQDPSAGDWVFFVSARSLTGSTSVPVEFDFAVQGWEAIDGPLPNGLATTDGGSNFNGKAPTITWVNTFPPNYVTYLPKNVIRVYDPISNVLLRQEQVSQPTYTYDYEKNVNDGGPRRSVRIDVTALSTTGVESPVASITVANASPAKITPTLAGAVGSLDVSWPVADTDYAGSLVWASLNAGYTPVIGEELYNGPDTNTTLFLPAGTWYVWVGEYDAFGTAGLNISDPQHLGINDLTSTLAAVVPALIEAKGGVTIDDMEDVGDQIAGILAQMVADRDYQDELHKRSTQILAVKTDTLSATVATEITARVEADFAEATARQVLEATINTGVLAAILSEQIARVSADSALASDITTLSTSVGDNSASLTTLATSVDGVKVQYGVIGTIDGTTGGFLFTGVKKLDGTVSFTLQIAGDLIVNNSISAAKLSVTSLSAIAANVGTLTAGMIRSTNNLVRLDLTNATLIVADS